MEAEASLMVHIFEKINKQMSHGIGMNTFVANQLNIYISGFQINPDVSLLCLEHSAATKEHFSNPTYINKNLHFKEPENAGSEVSYHCSKCRTCNDCKTNESIVATSIREEMEQELINKSMTVHPGKQVTIATLPFTHDPQQIGTKPSQSIADISSADQEVTKASKRSEGRHPLRK